MTKFIQTLIIGLEYGCVYSLIAMGMVLVYRTTGVLNIAHGVSLNVTPKPTCSNVSAENVATNSSDCCDGKTASVMTRSPSVVN